MFNTFRWCFGLFRYTVIKTSCRISGNTIRVRVSIYYTQTFCGYLKRTTHICLFTVTLSWPASEDALDIAGRGSGPGGLGSHSESGKQTCHNQFMLVIQQLVGVLIYWVSQAIGTVGPRLICIYVAVGEYPGGNIYFRVWAGLDH